MANKQPIPQGAQDRFWDKVDRRGPDDCWEWKASGWKGYGHFFYNGRRHRAHRFAWWIVNETPFPRNMFACHKCDNPSCVNPAHIFPGTNSDNIQDAADKGRHHQRAVSQPKD